MPSVTLTERQAEKVLKAVTGEKPLTDSRLRDKLETHLIAEPQESFTVISAKTETLFRRLWVRLSNGLWVSHEGHTVIVAEWAELIRPVIVDLTKLWESRQ